MSLLAHDQPLPPIIHVEASQTGLQLTAETLPWRLTSCQQDQAGKLGNSFHAWQLGLCAELTKAHNY